MFNTDKLSEKISSFADAALIFSPENRLYFTGFPASDGLLLVTKTEALFFTDSRYTQAAENAIGKEYVRDSEKLYEKLNRYFKANEIKTVAIENDRMTLEQFESLRTKLHNVKFVKDASLTNAVNRLRIIKSEKELEKIEAAQSITDSAFTHILNFIQPGRTEKEIALELDFFMLKNGADALSFETIAVAGAKSSMPHGVPGDIEVKRGDFITMDYGAVVGGYHSDMTRTVVIGSPSEKQAMVYDTVLKAQLNVLSVLSHGVSGQTADSAARDIIYSAGFKGCFGHSTGHGVGIEIHEYPSLSPNSAFTLECGNVVTVEPGIYIPGEFGVRIEDMAYITENGALNLTNSPKQLITL